MILGNAFLVRIQNVQPIIYDNRIISSIRMYIVLLKLNINELFIYPVAYFKIIKLLQINNVEKIYLLSTNTIGNELR